MAEMVFVETAKPRFTPLRRRSRVQRFAQHNSQFHGVSWHQASGQWQAHVPDPATGHAVSLGLFASERDAAEAVDCARLVLEGESANTNLPSKFYSRARIKAEEQRLRDFWRPRPSSQYYGVYKTRGSTKWKAEIELHGVKQFLDYFDDELEAAQAVDDAIRSTGVEKALQLPLLNFRREGDYFVEQTWNQESTPRGASSCFLGVTYHQPSNKYLAKLGRRHLGLFDTELEAARAFDEASHAVAGPTNFQPSSQRVTAT